MPSHHEACQGKLPYYSCLGFLKKIVNIYTYKNHIYKNIGSTFTFWLQ